MKPIPQPVQIGACRITATDEVHQGHYRYRMEGFQQEFLAVDPSSFFKGGDIEQEADELLQALDALSISVSNLREQLIAVKDDATWLECTHDGTGIKLRQVYKRKPNAHISNRQQPLPRQALGGAGTGGQAVCLSDNQSQPDTNRDRICDQSMGGQTPSE